MGHQQALLAGASIGLTIAAPFGPMALLVIQRTLDRGFSTGMATATGASTINFLYAALALQGLNEAVLHLQAHRQALAAFLASVLLILAARTLVSVTRSQTRVDRAGSSLEHDDRRRNRRRSESFSQTKSWSGMTERSESHPALARNYLTAIAFNAVNPLGFALLVGALSTVTDMAVEAPSTSWALVAGIFLGSIVWWFFLVTTTATLGCRLSLNYRKLLDATAALAMAGLGIKAMLGAI